MIGLLVNVLNYLTTVSNLSFILFFISLYICIPNLLQSVFQNNEKHLTFESKIEWTNRIVATISSITAFISSMICLYYKDIWVINEMSSTCALSDFILKFISFYFLFDSIHLIVFRKVLYDWATIIHHILIGLSSYVFIGLYLRKTHLILIYFLLFEITNPFIHMRWFLIDLKLQDHKIYQINGFIMAFFFVTIRDIYVPIKVSSIYFYGWRELPTLVNFIIAICFPLITYLNFYWTFLIIKGNIKYLRKSKSKNKL